MSIKTFLYKYNRGSNLDVIIKVPGENIEYLDKMGWTELKKLYINKSFSPFKNCWRMLIMNRINGLYKFYYKSGINKILESK